MTEFSFLLNKFSKNGSKLDRFIATETPCILNYMKIISVYNMSDSLKVYL